MLKPVSLTGSEERNPKLFCDEYTEIIYGEESVALKNELINCKQAAEKRPISPLLIKIWRTRTAYSHLPEESERNTSKES